MPDFSQLTPSQKLEYAAKQAGYWQSACQYDKLPYLKEAQRAIFGEYGAHKFPSEFPKTFKTFDERFDVWLDSVFPTPLSLNVKEVTDAALKNDAEFFVSLGEALRGCRKKNLPTSYIFDFFLTGRGMMELCWTGAFLWLMTDKAGLEFFSKVLHEPISLDAYKKNRHRSHFIKHPEVPIVAVREVGNLNASQREQRSETEIIGDSDFSLVLRDGWTLSKSGLLRKSR